jgi:hypothetical protein
LVELCLKFIRINIFFKVPGTFPGPYASGSYVHRVAFFEGEPWCIGKVVAL